MDLQDKYDELVNIVCSLDILIDETTDRYYKDILNDIKYEAQNELEEIEPILIEEQNVEKRALELEYTKSVI